MPAQRVQGFGSSIIREMTRLSLTYDALNLSQGFPDFPAPEEVTRAAVEAIEAHVNQYTVTWGIPALREAIAEKARRFNGLNADPLTEVVSVSHSWPPSNPTTLSVSTSTTITSQLLTTSTSGFVQTKPHIASIYVLGSSRRPADSIKVAMPTVSPGNW